MEPVTRFGSLIGRILLGILFLASGLGKIATRPVPSVISGMLDYPRPPSPMLLRLWPKSAVVFC